MFPEMYKEFKDIAYELREQRKESMIERFIGWLNKPVGRK